MTREDIIRMAREAGLTSVIDAHHKEYGSGAFDLSLYEEVTRFDALVAAAEREQCPKVCDDFRKSSTTSNTSPCVTRTSLPCACSTW